MMNFSGIPFDFLTAFLGGILVSFTPCVYPLLPITVAYIGASGTNSKLKGFSLSLTYVTGISITYAILGMIAVLTGSIFGKISSLPLVRIIVGLIIIFFGFIIWSGRGIRFPGLKSPLINKSGSYLSCFILGLVSGFLISPCIVPVLGSILAFVATKRNFIYGALLLFSFAFGMGTLLILAGSFSSILTSLPKTGKWMEIMKKICAIILIAIGIYLASLATFDLVHAQDIGITQKEISFTLKDIEGNEVTLSEFKNKKSVILFFWTTWCPYCLQELNKINQNYSSFVSEDIEILAINIQESTAKVKQYIRRNPVVFKVLLDSDAKVANSFDLIGVPSFVLVNKEGETVYLGNRLP